MITAPSQRYLDALRHAHSAELRITLWDGPTEVGPLPVTAFNMTIDGTANVWRNAQISFGVDPWDTPTREYLEQVSVQQGLVTVEHGIRYLDETIQWVQIATLRVDSLTSVVSGASRSVTAFDVALLVQEHVLETGRPLDDTYVNLIETMLGETLPNEVLTIDPGINTVLTPSPGKVLNAGAARLDEMQRMAEAVEGWIYNDELGNFHLGVYEGDGIPVWRVDAGEGGVFVDASQDYSRREQYNAVGIEITPAEGNDWRLTIFMWDNDPASPTYYDGPFGKRPLFFTEEYDHLPTEAEAIALARRKLDEYSGSTRSLSLEAVYNPLLVPGDVIEVVFPDGEVENHIIDTIDLNLGPGGRMNINTRLQRLETLIGMHVTGSATGRRA